MTEGMPPTAEEIRQLERDLREKVLDRAASDPEWKQMLLDDPEAAIREAGFPETERLQEIQAGGEVGEAEVVGHQAISPSSCWPPGRVCSATVLVDNTVV